METSSERFSAEVMLLKFLTGYKKKKKSKSPDVRNLTTSFKQCIKMDSHSSVTGLSPLCCYTLPPASCSLPVNVPCIWFGMDILFVHVLWMNIVLHVGLCLSVSMSTAASALFSVKQMLCN